MNFPSLIQSGGGGGTTSPNLVFSAGEVLDCLSDGIIATNVGKNPTIVYANPAACEITGYAAEELLGSAPGILRGPATDPSVGRRLREDLDAGKQFNGQVANYRKDGTPFVMEWSISTLRGPDGAPAFHVAVQRDATLPARRLLEAEHDARTDPLTGLPNRTHIDDILGGGGWLDARARSTVVVDLDHFKAVNDTYGHLVGDEILRLVAQRLIASARRGDIVARWGGEEFCILMLGQDDATPRQTTQCEETIAVADRVVEAVAATPFATSAGEIAVTASAGTACIGGENETARDLLVAADQAMYSAKRQGRNRAEQS
jgi:diguanylate cyclase (GGDEF)-like protein/PAS domain S-box-containing protein